MQTTVRRTPPGAVWVAVLSGSWVAISPFVLKVGPNTGAMWNNIVVGVVIVVLALIGAFANRGALPLVVVATLWLFASTFALEFSSMAFLWSNVISAFVASAASAVTEELGSIHSATDEDHGKE